MLLRFVKKKEKTSPHLHWCNCLFFLPVVGSLKSLYSYIEKLADGQGHRCRLCGRVSSQRGNLQKHVENIHFPGSVLWTCKFCGQTFTTRNNLNNHVTKAHH